MAATGADHVFLDARHLGREFLRAAVPDDRRGARRARLRPRRGPGAGRARAALPLRRRADRPPRPLLAARALRGRRGVVHRRPRRQPARVELPARGPGLRQPHRRRPRRPARRRRAAAARAGPAPGPRGPRARARAGRRPAGGDVRAGRDPQRRRPGDGGRRGSPRCPATRTAAPASPAGPAPRSGRRRTCTWWRPRSPGSRPCARRPAAATTARTSPAPTSAGGGGW